MTGAARLRSPAAIAVAALVAHWLASAFTSLVPGDLPRIGGLWPSLSSRPDTDA